MARCAAGHTRALLRRTGGADELVDRRDDRVVRRLVEVWDGHALRRLRTFANASACAATCDPRGRRARAYRPQHAMRSGYEQPVRPTREHVADITPAMHSADATAASAWALVRSAGARGLCTAAMRCLTATEGPVHEPSTSPNAAMVGIELQLSEVLIDTVANGYKVERAEE